MSSRVGTRSSCLAMCSKSATVGAGHVDVPSDVKPGRLNCGVLGIEAADQRTQLEDAVLVDGRYVVEFVGDCAEFLR